MNRSIFPFIFAAAALLLPSLCSADEVFPVVHSGPITIRVLSGRDGRPQPHLHVMLTGGYGVRDLALARWREEAVTDTTGSLHLSDGLRNLPLLRVEVLRGRACAPLTNDAAFSVELIRRDGLNGTNRCGTVAAETAPGVLTFYVKGKKAAMKPDPEPEASPELRPKGKLRTEDKPEPALKTRSNPAAAAAGNTTPGKIPEAVPELTDAEIDQMLAEQP
jgi:hypothetical protein